MAVPLMIYVTGVADPHVAFGTSAVAVATNAAANLARHAGEGNVRWDCAAVFSATGAVGAYSGSSLGKIVDGQQLLFLFALLMLTVGTLVLIKGSGNGDVATRLNWRNFPALCVFGFAAGTISGFFGIGGGFLITPSLMLVTGMPIVHAVGSSLVAVVTFGSMTAANYASSGYVDWVLASVFVIGGAPGGLLGVRCAKILSGKRCALNIIFATLVFAVAIYILLCDLISS